MHSALSSPQSSSVCKSSALWQKGHQIQFLKKPPSKLVIRWSFRALIPQGEARSQRVLSTPSVLGQEEGVWSYGNFLPTLLSLFFVVPGKRLCWVTPALQDKLDRSQSYGRCSKKLEHWMCSPPLFLPREKLGVGDFNFFTHCWPGGESYETMMTARLPHCCCPHCGWITPSVISTLK